MKKIMKNFVGNHYEIFTLSGFVFPFFVLGCLATPNWYTLPLITTCVVLFLFWCKFIRYTIDKFID